MHTLNLFALLVEETSKAFCLKWNYDTTSTASYIYASKAQIETGRANIGGVSGGKSASETRPKNIRLVYIIRIL